MAPLVNPTKHSWKKKKKKAIPHILFQKSEDVPTSLHKGSIILVPNGTNALRKNCGQHPSWTQMQNSLQNFSKPNQLYIKRTRYYDKRSSSQERSMVQHLENQRYSPLSMDRKEKPHHHRKDEGRRVTKFTIHSRKAQRSGNGRKLLQPGGALKERSAD